MQTKLIKTKDYLLLLCEKAEIWGGEYIYNSEYQKIIKTSAEYIRALDSNNTLYLICDKILAHLPLNNAPILEDVDLLPPFEEVDVEKLAKEQCPEWNYSTKSHLAFLKHEREGFIKGYKAAQQSNKQFSLKDIENILIKYLEEGFISKEQGYINPKTFLQSLSTQQLPKNFVPEIGDEVLNSKWGYGSACISKLKTITNSQGQKVVQGEYKFE